MFCPHCGKQLLLADQRFCAYCAGDLSVLAEGKPSSSSAAAVASPPVSATPLLDAAGITRAPAPASAPAPVGTSHRWSDLSAGTQAAVVTVLVAIGIAVIYFLWSSGQSHSGGISFNPSTISCSSGGAVTITVTLPASVKRGDQIRYEFDGTTAFAGSVERAFAQQADGSWQLVSNGGIASCTGFGDSPGSHHLQFLDSSGQVLVQGSYTVTP